MGQIYTFLGLTVGVVVPNMPDDERKAAYQADITYATNNELGFDYLRDNMKHERAQMVQRPFSFAIVDEVDSILIDEARTPLIISGPTDDKSDLYMSVDAIVKQIVPEDYDADEKTKNISLTEEGVERIERLLEDAGLLVGSNLYDHGKHHGGSPSRPGAARQRHVQARHRLHRQGRQGRSSSTSSPAG